MVVGSGLYMYDVVVKRSRSLSHLLMSSCVFEVSSSNNFRRLLDKVDLSQFTVLLWLFIVIILLDICKWLHALYVQ